MTSLSILVIIVIVNDQLCTLIWRSGIALQPKDTMLYLYNSGCRKVKAYMHMDRIVVSRGCRYRTVRVRVTDRGSVSSNPYSTRAVNLQTSTACHHKY